MEKLKGERGKWKMAGRKMVVYQAEALKRDLQRMAIEKGWDGGYTKYLIDNGGCYFVISQGKKNYERSFHDDHIGSFGYSEESTLFNVCRLTGLNARKYIFTNQPDFPEERIEAAPQELQQKRYATEKDKFLVTIHAKSFKAAMQNAANVMSSGSRTYSSYLDGLGLPNGCISQSIEKYRKVMRDAGNKNKGMMYIERYEYLCEFFSIKPTDYSVDYAEVRNRLDKEQGIINRVEQEYAKMEEPEAETVSEVNTTGLEQRLESLEKALLEINKTLHSLGNVHVQMLEKIQNRKPVATVPHK